MAQEYNRLEGYNLDKGSLSNVGISEENTGLPGYQAEINSLFNTITGYTKSAETAINSDNIKLGKKILSNVKRVIDSLIKKI